MIPALPVNLVGYVRIDIWTPTGLKEERLERSLNPAAL